MPVNSRVFQFSGLAALVVEYTSVAYFVLIARQPLRLSQTISDFGTFDRTRVIFSISFAAVAILFGLFGLWLYERLRLHRNFLITLYVGVGAELMLSLLPATGSTQFIHYAATAIMVFTLPVLIYYYALDHKSRLISSVSYALIACEVLAIVLVPLSVSWHISLAVEGLSFIIFHIWIVMATFES